MKGLIESLAQDALGSRNRFLTLRTPPETVAALLRSLHPRVPRAPLVRLGPPGDGGYLLPDDLSAVAACFSPGVSDISGFELDCANRGMEVFLADRSVDGPAAAHPRFHFVRKFIGATSHGDYLTLDDWVAASAGAGTDDLLLQMDIEGYEYETLLSASDALLRRFRVIVAEFHYLDELWNAAFFRLASRVFAKLLQTHIPVHAHPNNCCGQVEKWGLQIPRIVELTFVRSDRPVTDEYCRIFPHALDRDNTAQPRLPLPVCWYRG